MSALGQQRGERVVGSDWHINDVLPGDRTIITPDDHPQALAATADAIWFERHHGIDVCFRAPTDGEVATMPIGADWRVVVFQMRAGVRLRRFLPPKASS